MTKDFTRTLGDFVLAEVSFDYIVGADAEVERRYVAAREAFIVSPARDAAGVFAKLDAAHKGVREDDEQFSRRLICELEECQREVIEAGTDLGHVADAINVLARRFEREGLAEPWLRFLRAAACDARTLATGGCRA